MEKVIATAKYTLEDNWSIISGLLLTAFAIAGMAFASFQPISFSLELPPEKGVGALAAPVRPFRSQPEIVELMPEFEPAPVVAEKQTTAPIREDAVKIVNPPTSIVNSPANLEALDLDPVNAGPTKHENTAAILPEPEPPARILISSIGLDAPIVPAGVDFKTIEGKEFLQWMVPEHAAGWHSTSARLGEPGNTVLNGHHNAFGEVFKSLVDVSEGDVITVESNRSRFKYQITNKMIMPEKGQDIDTRMNNAQWLLPSIDERLTIISCWPYETNTHRLIVVARPISRSEIVTNLE